MTDHLHALPQGYRIQEYELLRVLGSGGFGIAYLGYDHNLDKAVAIKEYLPNDLAVRGDNNSVLPKSTQDRADYEWGLERFLNEAQALARFDHRQIIKIHRFFRAHGTGYIVMEYAEGETLTAVLQRKGSLTEAELKQLLFPILDGLEAVHQADFLHRDIKPSNIIIRDDGSPVLIDFGSARQAVAGKSRSVTAIVTPGYAPIEQYSSKGRQGPWTDIYGLGAVCYRCLTGEQPDDVTERLRKDPLVRAAKLCDGKASKSLLDAIDWALRVDEEHRPQTTAAWRRALLDKAEASAYREDRDTPKPTTRPSPPPSQASRDGRLVNLLLAGVVLALVCNAVYWWWQSESPTPLSNPEAAPVEQPGEQLSEDLRKLYGLPSNPEAAPVEPPAAEAEPPAKAPALVQRSQLTLDIQKSLSTLGYNLGTADGIYGERTKAAIRAFQQNIGIPVDGQISQQLLQTLRQELIVRQSKKDRKTNTKSTPQKSPINLTGSQEEYFTLGSHEDDVLRLQGTPSDISRYSSYEVWYFGSSKVKIDLRTRRVLEWDNNGNLNVRLLPGKQVTSETYFTRGSHQDDVLRLQGTPSDISRYSSYEVWYFGSSKVKIDLRTRRVLEWDNNGNLNVRLLPGKQVTSETYFTRGSHQDDVLRLQGTPSDISRYSSYEVWYFGSSKVKIDLRTRHVLEWDNNGNLNVRLLPGKQVTSETYFTRGSHQDDVLRLQGTPSDISRYSSYEVWYFGSSKVKIDLRTRHVLEWDNNGNLNVRLLPGKQVTSETYFTRGSHQDDVLRLQGTPSDISRYSSYEVWYFGSSKVKIDLRTRHVLEWSNNGNLKVKL